MPTANLMTGNANTMTIPQLDKIIEKLQIKLKENDVKNNDTLRSKVESLLYDYTKAKNKILRYYEKTKSKHPELVVGKKNTLTMVQILKNKGKFNKADNVSQKEQKWAYNVTDFLKDTKGYAIGIAATAGALGVANAISMGVANKGIMQVIGKAIGTAFWTSALSSSLITAGLAIGAACYLVPKIARSVQKIKNNKTQAREMNNEILNVSAEDNLDVSKSIDEIVEILNSNKNLNDMLNDPTQFTEITNNMTPAEVAKLKNAMASHKAKLNKEERENLVAAGKEKYKTDNLETVLTSYTYFEPITPNEDIKTLNATLATLNSELATLQSDLATLKTATPLDTVAIKNKRKEISDKKNDITKQNDLIFNRKSLDTAIEELKKMGLTNKSDIQKAIQDMEFESYAKH